MKSIKVAKAEALAIDGAFRGGPIDGRPIRLHTVGDCRNRTSARIVGEAASRWVERGGGNAWTYTHAWREVPRESWGPSVSVLGSIDVVGHARRAIQAGYAPARYVPAFPHGSRSWVESGVRWIPCPAQTREFKTDGIKVATTYASIAKTCPKSCKLKATRECYGMHGHVGLVTRRIDAKEHAGAIVVESSGNAKIKACAQCGLCLNADRLRDRGFGIAFSAHGVKAKSMKRRLEVLK